MARKRNSGQNNDQPERWQGDEEHEPLRLPRAEDDGNDTAPDTNTESEARGASSAQDEHAAEDVMEDEMDASGLPTAHDLASRGFTPDEVRRLEVVSDRQAQSDETQLAEATLRRLRFTRWLIEHGMLNEWSA